MQLREGQDSCFEMGGCMEQVMHVCSDGCTSCYGCTHMLTWLQGPKLRQPPSSALAMPFGFHCLLNAVGRLSESGRSPKDNAQPGGHPKPNEFYSYSTLS